MKPATKSRLADLAKADPKATAEQLAEQLTREGHKTSRTAVGRALETIHGPRRVGRARGRSADPEPTAAEITATKDLQTLDDWLAVSASMARRAEATKNDALLSKATGLATAILEAKRKAQAPEDERDGVWVSDADVQRSVDEIARSLASIAATVTKQLDDGATTPSPDACAIERATFSALLGIRREGA